MLNRVPTVAAALLLAAPSLAASAGTVIFVNAAQPPGGDGTSWATAYADLQDALADAAAIGGGDIEIWIAAGTYKPGTPEDGAEATFNLVSGIALYGGFAGGETSPAERDWEKNETVLSGLLGDTFPPESISQTVVTADNLSEQVIIDGLVIRDGYGFADGGGLRLVAADALIVNTKIMNNWSRDGAGLYIENGAVHILNSVVSGNWADGGWMTDAAAVAIHNSQATFTNTTFSGNVGESSFLTAKDAVITMTGSSVQNHSIGIQLMLSVGSTIIVEDSTFAGNGDGPWGGHLALFQSELALVRTTFTGAASDRPAVLQAANTNLQIIECDIVDNWSESTSISGNGSLIMRDTLMAGGGGGISWVGDGEILGSVIEGQFGMWGVGGVAWSGNLDIVNTALRNNGAVIGPTGLVFSSGTLQMVNTLVRNSGDDAGEAPAGVRIGSGGEAIIRNSTIIKNFGSPGGILIADDAHAEVINSIIWGNDIGWDPEFKDQINGPATVSYTLVESETVWPGEGNINADPLFADDDGRLSSDSPAIDAGSNAFVPLDVTTDLDGSPRITDGTGDGVAAVDMGAFEFQCIHADLNCDEKVNVKDLLILIMNWGPCPQPRHPAEPCPADLDGNGVVNVWDLLTLIQNWTLH